MKKEEIKELQTKDIDAFIEKYDVMSKTSMTREQIHKHIMKATVTMNLSLVLSDVVNTLVLDTESYLSQFGAVFNREDKYTFNKMMECLKAAKKWAGKSGLPIYNNTLADAFAEDSDWWYNMIRLIEDRTGDDIQKTRLLLQYVTTMPSVMQMFNIKYKDFKRTLL